VYSGTTFHSKSGLIVGVHQRIDRIARRTLKKQLPNEYFPSIREILHFEGNNGPDGIKRKSPARDEPWHFIDPSDPNDRQLLDQIEDHIYNLAAALRATNNERAAFEAAWLAHAITDGLTPAHHYPFEEEVEKLRGEGRETRDTLKKKLVISGDTRREQLVKNWKYWGAKGVMVSHVGFEHGVAAVISPQKIAPTEVHARQLTLLEKHGYEKLFLSALSKVDSLHMYDEFLAKGWTRRLGRRTRDVLIPTIAEMVTLAWMEAIKRSKP